MLLDVLNLWKKRNDLNSEIYNLTKDTVTVKQVAQICKKYNPKVKLRKQMMKFQI